MIKEIENRVIEDYSSFITFDSKPEQIAKFVNIKEDDEKDKTFLRLEIEEKEYSIVSKLLLGDASDDIESLSHNFLKEYINILSMYAKQSNATLLPFMHQRLDFIRIEVARYTRHNTGNVIIHNIDMSDEYIDARPSLKVAYCKTDILKENEAIVYTQSGRGGINVHNHVSILNDDMFIEEEGKIYWNCKMFIIYDIDKLAIMKMDGIDEGETV